MDIIERSNRAYALHVEALALRAQGRNDEAEPKWAEIVKLAPHEPMYLIGYADCLARLRRWEDDLHYALLAAALDPTDPEAWALAGAACGQLGRQDDVIHYLNRAEALAPNSPNVRWNRALWTLLHGNYAEGWREYEWRFMFNVQRRTIREPWNGQAAGSKGKVLLIWAEQGLGDTIHFVRFVKAAKERWGGRVVLEVQEPLVPLLYGQDLGADELILQHGCMSIPYRDFEHISLLSLPRVLGIDDEKDFWPGEYLKAAPGESFWADHAKRVGVCWKGSAGHFSDDLRSIDEQAFFNAIVKPNPDLCFHSINPDAPLPDCANCVNPDLSSFAETARVIKGLDLVITVDTAVAHLAGALGVPTWLLVRYATDWRWCVNHPTSTPWYPSMRLFRQSSYGDWSTPLEAVAKSLAEEVAIHG